jgi:glycine/D-amino acid oxidase-like deaminating enzyme
MEARLDAPDEVSAPDVVIIGAGVVGAALAYECARRGQRVLVLEREAASAQGATRWSMGGTHWLTAAMEVQALRLGGSSPAVETPGGLISAGQVILATGAWGGRLLRQCGISVKLHHTHADIVETEPLPRQYRHVVVAALPLERTRGALETALAQPDHAAGFAAEDGTELPIPASTEIGVVQLPDGRVRLGQVSRAVSGFWDGPHPDADRLVRAEVERFFPDLAQQPGIVAHRPVGYPADRLPIAGPVPGAPGLWLVGGLVSPIIYLPSLAPRLAAALAGEVVPELAAFGPGRLMSRHAGA